MRDIADGDLTLADIPPPDADWGAISEFALTAYSGADKYAGKLAGLDDLANASRHWSLAELRAWLFFEQRGWRHYGGRPGEREMADIWRVVDLIRERVATRMGPPGWLNTDDVQAMLGAVRGRVSPRKLRLFACGCCRAVWHLIPDPRNRHAVEVAEGLADGAGDPGQLAAAYKASSGVYANTGPPKPGFPGPATGLSRSGWEAAQAATRTAQRYAGDESLNHGAQVVAQQAGEAAVDAALGGRPSGPIGEDARREARNAVRAAQSDLARDVFGNPFRPVRAEPTWLTPTAVALARGIYEDRAFDRLPILADALLDAGCDNATVLDHCRSSGPHVRGCWVVDLVLGKE